LRDTTVSFFSPEVPNKFHIRQTQTGGHSLEFILLRPIACNHQVDVRHSLHCGYQVIDPLLRRQPAEVQDGPIVRRITDGMNVLKMGQHFEERGIPAMLDKLVTNEPAGGEKQVDTLTIRSQPAMNVSFCN
jgi:hypothetical protein